MLDSAARRVCRSTSRIVTSPVWSGGGQSQSPAAVTRDADIENTGTRQRMSRLKVTKEAAVFYFWGASPAEAGRAAAGSEADGSEDSGDPLGSSCLLVSRPPASWGAGHWSGPPGPWSQTAPGSDTCLSPAASFQPQAVTQNGLTRNRDSESLLQVHNIWDTGACWWFIRGLLFSDDGYYHRSCFFHVVTKGFILDVDHSAVNGRMRWTQRRTTA